VDQKRKTVRKYFYTNKSFQRADILLITTSILVPAKGDPDTVKNSYLPSSGQGCRLLE
jgi:hypothetical protein